jgi:hypothetical protein
MVVLLGRDSIAKHRPVAGVADSRRRGQQPRLQLRRQHGRERHLTVDGWLENFLNGRSDFGSVTTNDPDLLLLLKRAARHDLEQNSLFGSGIIEPPRQRLLQFCRSPSAKSGRHQYLAFAWTPLIPRCS